MIELFDGYKIDVDATSYTLFKEKKYKTKKGEEALTRDVRGYYGTLEGALKALSEEMIRDRLKDETQTLTEALKVVQESRDKVAQVVKEASRSWN